MPSKKIAHDLRLDCIGGVEKLFANFVSTSKLEFPFDVFVDNKRIHPFLSPTIQKFSHKIFMQKKWGPLPIPKRFRPYHKQNILNKSAPNLILYWNKLDPAPPSIPYIYYEHGHGWTNPDSKDFTRFLNGAKELFTCSEGGEILLRQRWEAKPPITIIPNGVLPEFCCKNPFPKQLPLKGPITLGLAGRFHPVKGHCLALHALRLISQAGVDCRLLFSGWGREEKKLKALASTLNLASQVEFLGNQKEMAPFYEACDFYLAPSIRESFGLAVIEAMSYGCVPIVTAIDGLAGIVQDQISGILIEPELPLSDYPALGGSLYELPEWVSDIKNKFLKKPALCPPEALCSAVLSLVENPNCFFKMSEKTIERAFKNFPFSSFIEKLDSCLQTTIVSKSSLCA